MAQAKQDLQAIINDAAQREGVDPELMQKIGGSESSLKASAKNPKSTAKGLFQFVDATWKEMGGKPGQQYDPQKNAELGAKYVKKNVEALAQSLGRDPSHGEVYAAHFFGTNGAKTLLTKADPNAPIEQSLAMFESPKRVAKVLKQNPNLQGKTTAQVLADLDKKMGGQKPQTMAGEPAAPAKSSPGFFRSPVPHFIRSEAPNLGTGYNAALALMGMSDKDELEKAQETIAQAEEENSVADFGQAKQMLAGVQAPNAFAGQKPRMMAEGGFVVPVQRNIYRQEDRQYLDEQLANWNKYNEQANDYNTKLAAYQNSAPVKQYATAAEAYNSQLADYNKNQYEPYRAQVDAYNTKLAAFNASPEYTGYQQNVTDYNNALNQYQRDVYNPYKAQVDQYNTGLEAFKAGPYVEYDKARTAYNATVDAYNNAPVRTVASQVYYGGAPGGPGWLGKNRYTRWNAQGPGEATAFLPGYEFVNTNPAVPWFGDIITKDVAKPGTFTAVEPTYNAPKPTAPTAFDRTAPTEVKFGEVVPTKPADFTMATPTAPAGFGEATPVQPSESINAVMARKQKADAIAAKDAEQRGIAINAANNPNQYNLAGFGSAGINAPTIALMAKGGEAKKSEHDSDAEKLFDDFLSAEKQYAPPVNLDFKSPPAQYVEGMGWVAPPPSVSGRVGTNFDALGGNVRIGAQGMAMQTPDKKILTMPGMYDVGYKTQVGPHNLDLSFQKEIKAMPGREKNYAVNARYKYEFAEGGEVAPEPEKGSAKAMLKEVGRSTQYAPADLAGSPVDLVNLGLKGVDAMTGTKLAQNMPVGGAEWLIDKANQYGLMDKPTGSTTESLTRFATGMASPAGVAKGVAMAGGKAAGVSRKALDEIYELSGMSKAKKAASVAEEAPVVSPRTTPVVSPITTSVPAPTVEQAPRSQSRSMLDEIEPAIQKLINEPRAKGFEGPQLPKRTLTTPTPDRPFVSPLDKFFAQGNNPVTVEQLTNQLAKGSRDYEMNRVAKLLEGKSPKDKVRPADLLKQLEETSPSRFRVQIKEPDPKNMGQFYASMENPFPSKPMGAVNLLEDVTPQEKLAQSYLEDMQYKQMYRYKGPSSYSPQEKDTAAKQLEVFFGSPMAKEIVGNNLASSFKRDVPEIRLLRSKIDEIRNDMNDISYPSQASKYGFDIFKESQRLQKEAYEKYPEIKSISDVGERVKKLSAVVDPVVKNNAENAILSGLDKKYGTNLLVHRESLGSDWDKLSGYDKSKITERMLGDLVGGDLTKSIKRFDELERPYRDAVSKALSQNEIYKGEHSGIVKEKPISFSRFQDVTLPTKENVMVIPELQSDRYDDLLKKGSKSGSQYKDSDELAQLDQDLDSVTRKIYKATDATLRDQLKLQGTKIEQRMANLRERLNAGDYSTPEFTPGIERMPQVMQQIMLKNAVHAGIQRGKNGVLFPGSDSAQAQLYEKLPNNIRSVLKDLGPGFEMRKVPLQYENGSTIDRYGIFWKDDAAQRISKEGVRFKKGGMVDKNDDENQKYI